MPRVRVIKQRRVPLGPGVTAAIAAIAIMWALVVALGVIGALSYVGINVLDF